MTSYVDGVLLADERVLHRGSLSLIPYAGWILLGVLLAVVVVGIGILIWVYVKVRTTEIAITSKRVIVKTGFVRRSTVEINLSKVESIQVDQGLAGRLFNYGTVIISGAGNPVAPITDVANPLEFRRKFMEATDRQQFVPEPAPSTSATKS